LKNVNGTVALAVGSNDAFNTDATFRVELTGNQVSLSAVSELYPNMYFAAKDGKVVLSKEKEIWTGVEGKCPGQEQATPSN
jgi:hypothetical protein